MVMRDTSVFSVRPTVSESMLNARRRKSEATRVRTPGLFSTCTTKVFIIWAECKLRIQDSKFKIQNVRNRKSKLRQSHIQNRKPNGRQSKPQTPNPKPLTPIH